MTDVLSSPAAHALARALGHFVWQGATIGLVMLVAFRLFRSSASARYAIGVLGLAAMLAAPIITFVVLMNAVPPPIDLAASTATGAAAAAANPVASATSTGASAINPTTSMDWLAIAVLAWMAGAAAFTLRLAGGWIVARRYVTRAVQPASEQIVLLVHDLAERMNVRGAIAVVQSAAVSVPVMVGWLKPTIVLPIAALAGLAPDQIEALIAHELAHVKRHDYLVNLLQSTAEALLFYHPAVWWLSRRVRAERELCCDDVAVSVCDRLVYVRALTDLATLASPNVALAATGGDLLARVRRLLGAGDAAPASRNAAIPLIATALVAAFVVPAAIASAPPQHPIIAQHAGVDATTHDLLHQTPTPTPSPTVSPEVQDVIKKHLEELHRKVAEMQDVEAQKKAELHQQAAKTVDQAKLAQEAELVALQQQFERVKQLYEKGLTSQAQLNEVIAALTKAQAKGDPQAMHAADLAALEHQFERTQQLFQRGLVSEAQLSEAQAALAKTQASVQAKGDELATAAAQLKAAQIELERAKTLMDKGLMNANTVASLEQNVANLQRQVAQIEEARKEKLAAQATILQADAQALREQLAAAWQFKQIFYLKNANALEVSQILGQMLTGTSGPRTTITANKDANSLTVQASESMLGLIKNIIEAADKPKSEVNAQTLKDLEARLKTQTEPQAKLLHQPIERTIEHLSPTTFVRAGDIVNLTISGEPGLPNTYVVAEDGTIRVPFMGSIKVAGLNATQIRTAIGKIMADKKLGTIDQVTVRAARPSK